MIKSLQILRAFAALGVVLAHYELFGVKSGGFGVDIFFIMSGFIISYVVNYSTKGFLKKRIARVVPLYTLATLLTTFLAFIKPGWFKSVIVNPQAFIKSLLYIPYRLENSGPILSLGWTLNNEMFFYLVMTLCILFFKKKKHLALYCGVFIIIFYSSLKLVNLDGFIFKFYREGLLPEFIYGIILYYVWEYYKKIDSKKIDYLIILFGLLSLIFLIYVDITGDLKFISRNIWRGIPSFILVLAFLASEKFIIGKSVFSKFLMELGEASYVMYLFHPYVIFGLTRIVYPMVFKGSTSIVIELIKFFIMLIILCVVCILMYRFIDKPMSKYVRKLLKA